MKRLKIKSCVILAISLLICQIGLGQMDALVQMPKVGKVKPRHSAQIAASNWSIGGETMDRDYTTYEAWKQFLGPTGAKKIRLQAGWAKCESEKGSYDFRWLDEIIDDVIQQGVEPWLQTSYGNPIYEGGGDIFLSGGFPTSQEALEAWDQWIIRLVRRYSGRVKTWEVWNESDLNIANTAEAYARLFIRTAEIIRAEIPDATIYALSLARPADTSYVRQFLEYLTKHQRLHLVDEITVDGYTYRPEEIYASYATLQRLIYSYSESIKLHQGELGCPSENQPQYALRNYDWTELSQSKWLLRKLLGDLGHDLHSLYFSIIDMNYIKRYQRDNGIVTILKEPIYTTNTKGLIKANKDNSVAYLKPSYYAFQTLTSIFDHTLERIPNYGFLVNTDTSLAVFGFQNKNFDYQAVAIWMDSEIPHNRLERIPVDFEFSRGNFVNPVYIDMQTGIVYKIPDDKWSRRGTVYLFSDIPIYDSPILIAEKSLLQFE